MTARKFNEALAALGFTQVGFAKKLSLDPRTVRRYCAGQWPVPDTLAALLNLMLDTGAKPDQLRTR
jgi:hypothetical protein